MLYSKPDDIRYTDMCIDWDKHFYEQPRDDDKYFMYLYLILYMLACKENYFKNYEDYDGYSRWAAITLYARILRKEKNGEKITNILDYVKGCMSHTRTDYQKEAFRYVTKENDEEVGNYSFVYRNSIARDYCNEDIIASNEEVFDSIPNRIKKLIKNTPYKNDKVMCKKLYMSCLLTFLNSITLPNDKIRKLKIKEKKVKGDEGYFIKQLQECKKEEPILWELDSKYSQTVQVLVNLFRSQISDEIDVIHNECMPPEDVVDAIVGSAFDNCTYDDYNEREDQ